MSTSRQVLAEGASAQLELVCCIMCHSQTLLHVTGASTQCLCNTCCLTQLLSSGFNPKLLTQAHAMCLRPWHVSVCNMHKCWARQNWKIACPFDISKSDLSQWCCRQHSRGSSSNSNYSRPLTVSTAQQKMLLWMRQQMRHQAATAASRRMVSLRMGPAVASSPGNPSSVTHQNRSRCQHMLHDNTCM